MLAQQPEFSFLVMIKVNLVPALRTVATVAFLAIAPLVDVLDFVAADAGFIRILEFLVDMTGCAGCFLVRTLEREVCFLVMIEGALLPGVRRMAVAAFFAVFALVNIHFLVAAVTILWCLVVLLVGFVTGLAIGSGVHALELKIRFRMIEGGRVHQDNFRIPAFVFGMAVLALGFYCSGQAPVQACFIIDVIEDVFMVMTVHTQVTLPRLVGCVVAFVALLLEFFMGLDHRPGHQKGLDIVCITALCK